jgi:hypothetical protein
MKLFIIILMFVFAVLIANVNVANTAISFSTIQEPMHQPPIVWSKTRLDSRSRLKGIRRIVLVNSWQKSYARTCKQHV